MFYSSPISNKMITFYFALNEQEVILGGIGAINICSFMTFSFLLAFEVNKTKKTKQKTLSDFTQKLEGLLAWQKMYRLLQSQTSSLNKH